MLKKRIIPCLDINNGRVVKGINFINLVDAGDPAEQAKIYNDNGADEICFLDISASYEKRKIILEVVKKTTEKCFVPLTVGGGVRTIEDINDLLLAGADKVSINTAAVSNQELIKKSAEKFGTQCIDVADDAKKDNRTLRQMMDEIIQSEYFRARFGNAHPLEKPVGWNLPLGSIQRKNHGNGFML